MPPPQFDSLQALWQMAGVGQYVWLAWGLTLLLSITLFAAPLLAHRRLLRRAARARRAARLQD